MIITFVLLTLFVFAVRTLYKEHKALLLFGSSFVNLIAGLMNGLAADTLLYRGSPDLNEIKIYEISTYCLYISGLTGIGIGLISIILKILKGFRK